MDRSTVDQATDARIAALLNDPLIQAVMGADQVDPGATRAIWRAAAIRVQNAPATSRHLDVATDTGGEAAPAPARQGWNLPFSSPWNSPLSALWRDRIAALGAGHKLSYKPGRESGVRPRLCGQE